MLEIVRGAVPEFVKVTDCAALVVPTSCDPKLRLAGEKLTAGAVPVPLGMAVDSPRRGPGARGGGRALSDLGNDALRGADARNVTLEPLAFAQLSGAPTHAPVDGVKVSVSSV